MPANGRMYPGMKSLTPRARVANRVFCGSAFTYIFSFWYGASALISAASVSGVAMTARVTTNALSPRVHLRSLAIHLPTSSIETLMSTSLNISTASAVKRSVETTSVRGRRLSAPDCTSRRATSGINRPSATFPKSSSASTCLAAHVFRNCAISRGRISSSFMLMRSATVYGSAHRTFSGTGEADRGYGAVRGFRLNSSKLRVSRDAQ